MTYYGSLCTQIYDLDKPLPPKQELQFYLNYITSKEMKILEPMCGSGRFLIPILEKGYHIDGFDVSEDMLEACKQKLRDKNLTCNLTLEKADEFETPETYDLVITPGGSFSVIKDRSELIQSLKRIHQALKHNGKLVLELFTSTTDTKTIDEWKESNRVERADGKEIVQYSKSFYNSDHQIITWPLKYDLVENNKVIDTEEMVLYIKIHPLSDCIAILNEAGFHVVKALNGHSDELATEQSEVVIFECTKQ